MCDMPIGRQACHVVLPERRAAEPEAMRRGRMRAGMHENIIGWENLPASLLARIRDGIVAQRDGDEWTRFRPALAGRTDAGEPYIVDSDCVAHWVGDGSVFPAPDTPLPAAVRRAPAAPPCAAHPSPRHTPPPPPSPAPARYAAGGAMAGWMTDNGPYYAREWTLDRVVEQ